MCMLLHNIVRNHLSFQLESMNVKQANQLYEIAFLYSDAIDKTSPAKIFAIN